MVKLYKDRFGRGPTKARSMFAGRDLLICTLENTLTPIERKLFETGEVQRIRETRVLLQHTTESELCEIVERMTGRAVRAFVSGIDVAQDVASEVFYLEPESRDS